MIVFTVYRQSWHHTWLQETTLKFKCWKYFFSNFVHIHLAPSVSEALFYILMMYHQIGSKTLLYWKFDFILKTIRYFKKWSVVFMHNGVLLCITNDKLEAFFSKWMHLETSKLRKIKQTYTYKYHMVNPKQTQRAK